MNMKESEYFLSLGSNLGDKKKNLEEALRELEKFSVILKKSSIYETEPVGFEWQDDFFNLAVKIKSELPPQELIKKTQAVERRMGRKKNFKNGPRKIDLDIIFCDELILDLPKLKIPHPEAAKREFVLAPIVEIEPDKIHPVLGLRMREVYENFKSRNPRKTRFKIKTQLLSPKGERL